MKSALLIALFLSLAANAVFLVRICRSVTPAETTTYPASPDARCDPVPAQPAPAFSATDWSALQDASSHTLAFLRQLGLTNPEIRAIVRAEVDARYAAREHALRKSPAYWQSTFSSQLPAFLDTVADPAAVLALALQKENELRQLLGEAYEPAQPQLRQLASYLPFEKAWRLKLITDDYRLLKAEAKGRGTSLRLPVPREHFNYLREQQRADIEALLTPEELRAYDLRTSGTAGFLRNLAGFAPTEPEFLALYELRKPLEAHSAASARDQAQTAAFQETQNRIDQQTRELLGEKRYADYTRAQDPVFRFNRQLAESLNQPPETALAGYQAMKSLREKVAAFSAQKNTPESQVADFRAALLREAETTFTALYGKEGFDTARSVITHQLFISSP